MVGWPWRKIALHVDAYDLAFLPSYVISGARSRVFVFWGRPMGQAMGRAMDPPMGQPVGQPTQRLIG